MTFGAASRPALCPCGSGEAYSGCCGPLLAGAPAPSPQRLMRSRYTAFVRGDAAHLERTWHPRTRPEAVHLDPAIEWEGLEIVEASASGDEGTVAFRARWREGGKRGVLAERSRFARRGGRWLYVDGDVTAE
ncbi:YchJ family protein [Microbacterium sp. RD1]|uniref:YchJ family protein n=1 Tax=Microbacterium sp. RD1 TaxID=3457313 RepID=UPI003FA55AED